MDTQPKETPIDIANGSELGYRVFYSDSEEIAKLLAVSHIQATIHSDTTPIVRPAITFTSYFWGMILPFVLYSLVIIFAFIFTGTLSIWPFIIAGVTVFLCTAKHFVVLCVLLYQKFAPERIRRSCCFEPTCSNYMLQAIEKYGFLRGFVKGIRRLCRCHYPNGGVDLP